MSHAAGIFTRPSGNAKAGTAVPAAAATRWCRARSTTGFMKNEPTLRVSGSDASTTMPFRRRTSSTARRTSAAVADTTPARASASRTSGYAGAASSPRSA
jgi:hypothetical protein